MDGISSMATSADEAIDDAMAHGCDTRFDPGRWFATCERLQPGLLPPCRPGVRCRQSRAVQHSNRHPIDAAKAIRVDVTRPPGGRVHAQLPISGAFRSWQLPIGPACRRCAGTCSSSARLPNSSQATQWRSESSLPEQPTPRDPLTIDEYLSSRFISEPVRLLDCDYPCDVASAVIFTTEDRAHDCKKDGLFFVQSASSGSRPSMN